MKIEDVFRKLKPLAEKDIQTLWQEYVLADPKTQREMEAVLKIFLAKNLEETFEGKEILLEPPPKEVSWGEYILGKVCYGKEALHPFGLREDEWIQHIGIFGRSGSGKTNVAFILVLNLLKKGKPFLIFDWKRNYRDLISLFPEKEILVFTVGRSVSPFFFNPLIPPKNSPPTIWLKKLIEIMCHAYFLGEGVAYLFQKAIDSVYREWGIYQGQENYPNLMDVKEWLENYQAKGRESAWMDSALRAVGVLCYGEVGKVLNQRRPFPLDKLLEKNVILELDALTNSDKTFLIESLLLWIHHYRMSQSQREEFKHAILIEEAHHILMRKKQEIMGEEAITDIILREIRELGEAIVLIDQHPSLISKPALGNTYCTIAMNLKHRSDVSMISDSLLLNSEKTKYLGKLEVGTGMVKLQGRWFEPFLVKFPLVKVPKGKVTDEMIKEGMGKLKEVFMPREILSEEKTQGKAVFSELLEGEKITEKLAEKPLGISPQELMVLKDILKHGFSSTWERYQRLGLNAYQGNKLKESLLQKDLIEVKDLPTPTGRIKYWVLTAKAKDVLRELGINPNVSFRKGGPEHQYWKRKIAEEFQRRGYKVTEEYPIGGGKTIDLVAVNDKERVAIEIETGKSDAVSNVKKALDSGFDRVICIPVNRRISQRISRVIKGLDKEKGGIKKTRKSDKSKNWDSILFY